MGGRLRDPAQQEVLHEHQPPGDARGHRQVRRGGRAPGWAASGPASCGAALRQKAHLADSSSIDGANGTWQPLGKGPLVANDPAYPYTYGDAFGVLAGRISDYAYDASTNRLWATVAQGGVWESLDRGNTWFVVSDGAERPADAVVGGIGGRRRVVTAAR